MNVKYEAYRDGRIKVHTKKMRTLNGGFDLEEKCLEIFENCDYANSADMYIKNQVVEVEKEKQPFCQERYCKILETMYDFMSNSNINSMLYMGNAIPKAESKEMNLELLKQLGNLVCEDLGLEKKEFIVVLKSSNFDEEKEKLMERLENGEKLYIMSTYQTIGAGQNLQYGFKDKSKFVELVPYLDNGDKRHFKKDIDAIYLADITHVTVNFDAKKPISDSECMKSLIQTEELYQVGEINFKDKEKMHKKAIDARKGKANREKNKLNDARSVKMIKTQMVIQALGRLCRTHIKSPDIYIYADDTLISDLDSAELKRRILSPEMQSLLDLKGKESGTLSDEKQIIRNKAEKISTDGNVSIHRLLARGWAKESIQNWNFLRNVVLKYPTASEEDRMLNEFIKRLYICSDKDLAQYQYSQYNDFRNTVIDFDMNTVEFKDRAKKDPYTDEIIIQKVSEVDSKLPTILKYHGMREFFEENGYATSFVPEKYIMSPVLFHNIYKGALGEVSGKFILERERGIKLNEITEPEKFEFFDFEMARGVYVDFKNWKLTYQTGKNKKFDEISRKLDAVGGKRAYIINVAGSVDLKDSVSLDERIILIPALIDENGQIIKGALDKIRREDYELC